LMKARSFFKQIVQIRMLKLFCKLYCCIVVSTQKIVGDIKNWEEGCLKVVSCTDAWLWQVSGVVILLLRLDVDVHHVQVTVGD
jgi:hypothetical protein